MIRLLFLAHRYLGIALGLVVTLWCLSGLIMMYVQYPSLTDEEQLAGLAPLNLADCCRLPEDFSNIELDRFRVESLDGRPVLRLLVEPYQYVVDLGTGEYLPGFTADEASSIARAAARAYGLEGEPALLGTTELDQWTIAGYDFHLPLFHFAVGDPRGTELYVSSTTGEVVQMTTFRERFWSWMGSVVHWIYPTLLRQHPVVWVQTIIWLTIVSLFLTALGIYIGIRQYKTRRSGRKSPYRGWGLWHHYAGLIFGVFTLTWLISGLFSVNPWGAFESRSYFLENERLRGGFVDFERAGDFVTALPAASVPASTVRLEGSVVGGRLFVVAADRQGERVRLDPRSLDAAPLPDAYFANAGLRLRPDTAILDQDWITEGDAYYYSHHDARRFPVYRIQYEDGERFYLDAVTGELAYAVDRNRKWSRWIFLALHRGDFSSVIRSRPLWDVLMWVLMLGVTAGALSGTWLGLRRLTRGLKRPLTHVAALTPRQLKGRRTHAA